MTDITRLALQTQTDLKQQSNVEFDTPRYITLTRTATLAIATTGTTIVWQSEVRKSGGFTWSGSTVTIPMNGYYNLDFSYTYNAGSVNIVDLYVNSVSVARPAIYYGTGTTNHATMMRYFSVGDNIELRVTNVTARTLLVNAYGTAGESPFLHIVKV